VLEESGIEAKAVRLMNYQSDVDEKIGSRAIRLLFIAYAENFDVVISPDEHDEYAWVDLKSWVKYSTVSYMPLVVEELKRRGLVNSDYKHLSSEHGFFEITQGIILINSDHQALVMEHEAGKWLLPGGRLNQNENWEVGLRREVEEECGLTDYDIVGIQQVFDASTGGLSRYGVRFIGSYKSGEPIALNEMINFAWVRLKELDQINFWHKEIRESVRQALMVEKNRL
jgi:ADP-ribose pyrophosphatase YjhB (NUDIX family)